MTSKFVMDSFAWIEYFRGTSKGRKVKELLESQPCFTPTVVIAELSNKYSKENYGFWETDLQFIVENSSTIVLDKEIADMAGKLKEAVRKKYKTNFGLADAIILSTARQINAMVLTGDPHFQELSGIEFLK